MQARQPEQRVERARGVAVVLHVDAQLQLADTVACHDGALPTVADVSIFARSRDTFVGFSMPFSL